MYNYVRILILLSVVGFVFSQNKQFRMAFFYSGPINDFGYNYKQDTAQTYVSQNLKTLGYNVSVSVYENITVNDANNTVIDLCSQGYNMIFMTSATFASLTPKNFMASYPNTTFVLVGAQALTNNSVTIASRQYEGRYLAGHMCGRITKTNKIGFIAGVPLGGTISQLNAMAIAAQRVNPLVKVYAIWTNSFLDPLLATKATQKLIEMGVDCASAQQDDDTPQRIFNNYSIPCTGINGDMRYTAGKYVYFSQMQDFSVIYLQLTMSLLNGTFNQKYAATTVTLPLGNGLYISPYSPLVDVDLYRDIEAVRINISNNPTQKVLCGPDVARQGYNLTGNQCLTEKQARNMNFYFDMIITLPNMTYQLAITNITVSSSSSLGSGIMAMSIISCILCMIIIMYITARKDKMIIKSSSPVFLISILGSGIMALISCLMWVDIPDPNICLLRIWLPGISFGVIFGSFLIKNWRIYRIFTNQEMTVTPITNFQLFITGILPIIVIETIIMTVWTVLDPYTVVQVPSVLLQFDQLYLTCRSKYSWGISIYIVFKGIVLVAGGILAYKIKSKKIPKDYDESDKIGISTYNTILVGVIAIFIMISVVYTPYVEAGVISFAIIVMVCGLVFIIFIPKIINIEIYKIDSLSLQRGGTTATARPQSANSSGRKSSVTTTTSSNDNKTQV